MKNMIKIAALAVVALTLASNTQAIPISGTITLGGKAVMDGADVASSTQVNSWSGYNVVSMDGLFTSAAVPTIFVNLTSAALAPNWVFSGGAVTWSVGGFSFTSISSIVSLQSGGFLNVSVVGILTGVASGVTYDPTTYVGRFSTADPAAAGNQFSSLFAFSPAPAPDGATTATLLGLTLSGAALLRRKLTA